MKTIGNRLAVIAILGLFFAPADEAQVKHVEMRVEGMT